MSWSNCLPRRVAGRLADRSSSFHMSVIDLRRWWWCVMLPLCRGLLCFPCTLLSHRVGRASGGRNTTREPLCFRGLRCPSVSGTLLPFTLWLSRTCHGLELSTKTALGNGVHCLLPPHYAGPPPRPRAPAVSTAANSKQQRTNKVASVTPQRAATPPMAPTTPPNQSHRQSQHSSSRGHHGQPTTTLSLVAGRPRIPACW